MDIYTYPKSRSIRATWMAEELGLDYQCHFTDVMSAEKQVREKPESPALSDNGLVIFESSAICIYLAQTYGNGRFYPSHPEKQAIVNQWLAYIISELEGPLWIILRHAVVLPEAMRQPGQLNRQKRIFCGQLR